MDNLKRLERTNILHFIKQLSEKNYAAADKYLGQIVENRLAQKISNFRNTKLF